MPNFLMCTVDLNGEKYYQASLSIDVVIILITIVAYFSNELIISSSIATVSTIFTIFFGCILVVCVIKYSRGKVNF